MAVVSLIAAVAVFWVTINARFLEYPYWLAVQKADFILGPVFVGSTGTTGGRTTASG